MFDIGFSELVVIGIVALVVIGPERLPKVARTLGVLFGRLQRYVAQVKSDISREMELAELGKVKTEFENAARSFQTEMETKARDTQREIEEVQSALDREITAPAAPPQAAAAEPAPPLAEPPAESPQLELGLGEPAHAAGSTPREGTP